MTTYRRTRQLVQPRLQLKLIGTFFLVMLVGFLLQSILLHLELGRVAEAFPGASEELEAATSSLVLRVLLLSLGVLLPATLLVGVLMTHRIAGPAYRLESYLNEVEKGEADALCRLRQGDELKDLCAQLNRALTAVDARGRVWPAEESLGSPATNQAAPEQELSKAA